jgi:quercetin 2,3-dioxygenase
MEEVFIQLAANRLLDKTSLENTFEGHSFKEIELKPNTSINFLGRSQYWFLAFIGDVHVESNLILHTLEENQVLHVCQPDELKLINPYPEDTILFFVLEISTERQGCFSIIDSFEKSKFNTLEEITSNFHLGQFSGREKCELALMSPNAFVFCINGAFEVNERLLETKDALVLKNIQNVDFEALSEEAILLVFSF